MLLVWMITFCEYSKVSWMIEVHELTESQQHRGASFAEA
jgi:hypothetical protein